MPSRPTAADCAIWTRPHRAERRIRPGKGPGPAAGETDLVTATTLPMTVSPTALAHSRRTAPEYETDLSAKHALVRQHMSQRHVAAGDQRPGTGEGHGKAAEQHRDPPVGQDAGRRRER